MKIQRKLMSMGPIWPYMALAVVSGFVLAAAIVFAGFLLVMTS